MSKESTERWQQEHLKQVKLKLNLDTEKDLIDYLYSHKNVQGYLKELVRRDMERAASTR